MKKVMFMALSLLMVAIGAKAQDAKNSSYRLGYKFDVATSYTMQRLTGVSTTHGYNFGNGMFVGGGIGFYAEWRNGYDQAHSFLTPAYAEAKYSFMNTLASPYLALRAGVAVDVTDVNVRGLLNPRVGIDIWNFSLGVGYDWQMFNNARHGINFMVSYNF